MSTGQVGVTPAGAGGEWVMRHRTGAPAELRLVCLPHAGGGAGTFRAWPAALPAGVEVTTVRLPGREIRVAEPPRRRMHALADELAGALLPLTDRPYVMLGHSLGALTAYETARALLRLGAPAPSALVVSALRAPRWVAPPRPVFDLPEEQFLAHLVGLGGTPADLLRDRGLLELVLPALRADFELLDTYVFAPEAPVLPCPVVAVRGAADPTVDRSDLLAWAEHSCTGFRYVEVPGGHFCVHERPAETAAGVLAGIGAVGVPIPRR